MAVFLDIALLSTICVRLTQSQSCIKTVEKLNNLQEKKNTILKKKLSLPSS